MKRSRTKTSIFTSYGFIVAIALLLLNDFYLKQAFSNSITGKISDFTGLFAFALFWMALLPKHQNKVLWSIGIFFIWWKSIYSEALIKEWNSLDIIAYSRVIDSSDLIALVMLPVARIYFHSTYISLNKKMLQLPVFCVAIFSFFATSKAESIIETNIPYSFPFSKDSLVSKLYHLDEVSVQNAFRNTLIIDSNEMIFINKFTGDTAMLNEYEGGIIIPYQSDTSTLLISSAFCFTNFTASISVSPLDTNASQMLLNSLGHYCERKETDHDILLEIFETKVIQKMK